MHLLAHNINQSSISQRRDDGYINATALCKASGKDIHDYKRLDSTKAFINELSMETGIPGSKLVEVRKGKPSHLQGTWVHPQVAIHLAMWCSPTFAVHVTQWVVNWMTGHSQPDVSKAIQETHIGHAFRDIYTLNACLEAFEARYMNTHCRASGMFSVIRQQASSVESCLVSALDTF